MSKQPLCVALALAGVAGFAVPAAAASAPDPAAQAVQLGAVIVTGTRAPDRTAADSTAPIDVLTGTDLVASGASDLPTALRDLLPSFNFPQPWVIGATDSTMPAQLRGLSPDETLVLINGKRQHTTAIVNDGPAMGRGSSPVDLSAIPLNAIERIEVLRDGAAAQYGSDAIAGVINIILKQGEGGSANLTRGRYDGGQGFTWNGGADGGFRLGGRGALHVSFNYLNQAPTNHAGLDRRYPADPTYLTPVIRFGLPRTLAREGAFNGSFRLGDAAELYAFGVYNRRKVVAGESFRSLSDYQAGSPAAVVVYPAGYLPLEHSTIRDDSTVLGVRGTLADWDYDLSAQSGGSSWQLDTTGSFNDSLGAASPTAFHIGGSQVQQDLVNLDLRRDFDAFWGQPLTVAWGGGWRRDSFRLMAGDAASYFGAGSQTVAGFKPEDAGRHGRHSRAVYVDLETRASAALSFGAALRHERYQDFGNRLSGKLSGRYALAPGFALRASASTGFRAPSLQQAFYSTTGTEFVNVGTGTVPYTIRTFPVSDPAAVALGAQPLAAETSRNYGFGLVFTPRRGPQATLDFYQVDVDERIILSGNLIGPNVQDYLTSVGIPFVSGGRFFTNAVDTRTRGADLVGSWPFAVGAGEGSLEFGHNYNQTRVRAIRANPEQLGLAGLVLPVITRDEQGHITVGTPRNKSYLGYKWALSAWNARVRVTRYGPWTNLGSTPAADQTYAARTLLDVSLGYTWRNLTATLGGNNVTNRYPERNNPLNDFAGNIAYPWSSPFGFSGSYWYTTLAWCW